MIIMQWHCSIDYCVKFNSSWTQEFMPKMALISQEMISAKFVWGNVLLGGKRGKLQIYAKNSNFDNFQSILYIKSVSMPLSLMLINKHTVDK